MEPAPEPRDFPRALAPADAAEFRRRRRGRNIAMLLALLALSLVFYGLSMVKLAVSH